MSGAVWVAFFIAAFFSSTAHHPWTWWLPSLFFLAVLLIRVFNKDFPRVLYLAGAIMAGCLAYFFLLSFFWLFPEDSTIQKTRNTTHIGKSTASTCFALIGEDKAILGKAVGRRVRDFITANPDCQIILGNEAELIAHNPDAFIYAGLLPTVNLPESGVPIFLLNPELPDKDLSLANPTTVLWGEFHTSPALYKWRKIAKTSDHISFTKLSGEGTYLSSWLDYVHNDGR